MASECVKVMVRCRPMNSKETARGKFEPDEISFAFFRQWYLNLEAMLHLSRSFEILELFIDLIWCLSIGSQSICTIDKPTNQVILRPNEEGGPAEKIFAYDSVYGVDST